MSNNLKDDAGFSNTTETLSYPTASVPRLRKEWVAAADAINPDHYRKGGVETIDFIEAKGLDYNLGNAVKYISRAGLKDPTKYVEDLEKAIWYTKRAVTEHLRQL